MEKIMPITDSLIQERNDDIDNAAHDVILDILRGKDGAEKQSDILALCRALKRSGYTGPIISNLGKLTFQMEFLVQSLTVRERDDGYAGWEIDADHINAVADLCAGFMSDESVPTCRPYRTECHGNGSDGIPCHLSENRCGGCPIPQRKE